MLTRHNKLAKTSASPGKTQMINHFVMDNHWYIVDLPGYGYAKVSQKQRNSFWKMISDYLMERQNLMTVFVLIDSRLKPQKNDLEFLAKLGEWQVPFNIVFTKSDKNKQSDTAKNVRNFLDKMREDWEFLPRTFVTSAVKYHGRKEILSYVEELNEMFYEHKNKE